MMKTVLITGGSSGIGFEMSKHFAENGFSLYWVSHDQNELEEAIQTFNQLFPKTNVRVKCVDLTQINGPRKVFNWIESEVIPDVVINNAGFGTYGFVDQIDIDQELNMIDLNIVALYKLTRYFLNVMMKRNSGTIINICSNSAFQPIPRMTTYAATKGFVYQFSRGLQEEMEINKSNVRVLTVCPAAISDTPFKNRLPKNVKTFEGLVTTTAKEVAGDVWKAYVNGKSFAISGWKMRLLYKIRGLIPEGLQKILVRQETEEI